MGHTIVHEGDFAFARITIGGRQRLEAYRQALDALIADPAFLPGMACLWDCREVSHGSLSPDERRAVAHMVAERRQGLGAGRSALVVTRDVLYGTARSYQQQFESDVAVHFQPFRDLDEAVDWLREGSNQEEADGEH